MIRPYGHFVFKLPSHDMAIDLAPPTVVIAGRGVVLNEPSVLRRDDPRVNRVKRSRDAKLMWARLRSDRGAGRRDGVIADLDVATM